MKLFRFRRSSQSAARWLAMGAFIGAAMVFALPAQANEITLDMALSQARQIDARIQAAQAALDGAREEVRQAYGFNLPHISGVGSAGYTDPKDLNELGTFQQGGARATAGVEVNQQVLSFGRYSARRARASAIVGQAGARFRATTSEVLLETAAAYLEFERTSRILAAHQEHLETLATLHEATQAKFEAELTTATDVLVVSSRMRQAEAQLQSAQAEVNVSRQNLSSLIGLTFDRVQPAQPHSTAGVLSADHDNATTTGLLNSPRVHLSQAMEAQALADYNLARSELRPNVGLKGRTTRGHMNGRTIGSEEVSVVVTMPLYDGGISRSVARAQKYAHAQRLAELSETRRLVSQDISNTLDRRVAKISAANSWQKAVEMEARALEGIEQEVEERLRPITHLLEGKEDLLATKTAYENARFEALLADYQLLLATGQLDGLYSGE